MSSPRMKQGRGHADPVDPSLWEAEHPPAIVVHGVGIQQCVQRFRPGKVEAVVQRFWRPVRQHDRAGLVERRRAHAVQHVAAERHVVLRQGEGCGHPAQALRPHPHVVIEEADVGDGLIVQRLDQPAAETAGAAEVSLLDNPQLGAEPGRCGGDAGLRDEARPALVHDGDAGNRGEQPLVADDRGQYGSECGFPIEGADHHAQTGRRLTGAGTLAGGGPIRILQDYRAVKRRQVEPQQSGLTEMRGVSREGDLGAVGDLLLVQQRLA